MILQILAVRKKKTAGNVSNVENTPPVSDEEIGSHDELLSKKLTDQGTQTDKVKRRYFKHTRGSDEQVIPDATVDEFSPANNSLNEFSDDQNNTGNPPCEDPESATNSSHATGLDLIQAAVILKPIFRRKYPLRSKAGSSDNNGSHGISDVTRKSERSRGAAHHTCEENSDLPCQKVWR